MKTNVYYRVEIQKPAAARNSVIWEDSGHRVSCEEIAIEEAERQLKRKSIDVLKARVIQVCEEETFVLEQPVLLSRQQLNQLLRDFPFLVETKKDGLNKYYMITSIATDARAALDTYEYVEFGKPDRLVFGSGGAAIVGDKLRIIYGARYVDYKVYSKTDLKKQLNLPE
jgi:hypothetical protein